MWQVAPIREKGENSHVTDAFHLTPVFYRFIGNQVGPAFHCQDNNGWVSEVANCVCPATFNNLNEITTSYRIFLRENGPSVYVAFLIVVNIFS